MDKNIRLRDAEQCAKEVKRMLEIYGYEVSDYALGYLMGSVDKLKDEATKGTDQGTVLKQKANI